MLSKAADSIPSGSGLVIEPKWDGYRFFFCFDGDRVRAYTRHGRPHAGRFPYLEERIAAALPDGGIVDGELVALARTPDGGVAQDFDCLSPIFARRPPHEPDECGLYFVAFDLLELDGADLRSEPWRARRELLADRLGDIGGNVSVTPAAECSQVEHDRHLAAGFEGSVVKRAESRYLGGSRGWVKVKARRELETEVGAISRDGDELQVLCDTYGDQTVWAGVWRPELRGAYRRGELNCGDKVRIVYSNTTARGRLREARVDAIIERVDPTLSRRPKLRTI